MRLRCLFRNGTYKDMYEKTRGMTRCHKERERGPKGKRDMIRDSKREGRITNRIHLSIMS